MLAKHIWTTYIMLNMISSRYKAGTNTLYIWPWKKRKPGREYLLNSPRPQHKTFDRENQATLLGLSDNIIDTKWRFLWRSLYETVFLWLQREAVAGRGQSPEWEFCFIQSIILWTFISVKSFYREPQQPFGADFLKYVRIMIPFYAMA